MGSPISFVYACPHWWTLQAPADHLDRLRIEKEVLVEIMSKIAEIAVEHPEHAEAMAYSAVRGNDNPAEPATTEEGDRG